MPINKNRISLETIFLQINNLKNEFIIAPDIESISDLELLLKKEITIIHKKCGNTEKIILEKWLNSKKNPNIQSKDDKYTHYCKRCINKLRKDDLQLYINNNYNGEFILIGDYKGYHEEIELKHINCSESFFKKPATIKQKRLFCKHCGKSDSIYENSMKEKRNLELNDKFKEKGISTYIPLEDCPGLTKKMNFKHITCGSDFKATPYDIYNNYFKLDHCPNCFKKKPRLNLSEKDKEKHNNVVLRNRYYRFVKFSEEFEFNPSISSFEDFKKNHDKEFIITHKSCKRSITLTLDEWTKIRASIPKDFNSEKFLYLCPHCSEEILREDFQKFLNKKYNKEFLVVGKYKNVKHPIDVMHKECGEVFPIRPDVAKHKKIICKGCNSSDKKTENKMQIKKNKELLKKLKTKGLSDYIPKEDVVSLTKPMTFEHTRCGNTITVTPNSLLRSKRNKQAYCEKCPEQLLVNETDKTLRTKHAQDAINLINGTNKFNLTKDYDENVETVLLSHQKCSGEFEVSKRYLFSRETKCPHCETNNYKNNRYISITEKIKLYEEVLDNEYKILKPFIEDEEIVPIKHIKCGHIFDRTISSFLRSKGKLFCPKCRREEKLNKLKNKLIDKYNGEISVCNIEDYKNLRTNLNFIHNKCKTVFESNFDKILNYKNIPCPKCNPESKTLDKFKSEVYKKFKGEYTIVGKFNGYTKKISFRHKKCGRLFIKTPYDFLNSELPCSHCIKESVMVGMEEAQRRVDENSKGLFTLNGIYRGIKKEIPVTCNECGHVFLSTPKKMFLRKRCPQCKARRT